MTSLQEQVIVGLILLLISGLFTLIYKKWDKIYNYLERKRIEWFPLQQTITFSIKHNEKLNSGIYYEEIKKVFLNNLKKYKLEKSISHKDFSDIFLFNDTKQAQEFRNKKNLDLILWGEFSNDHLKRNGELESEIKLNFTYGYRYDVNNKVKIEQDIQRRVNEIGKIKNHWKIREDDSLEDVGKVADGMFTIALFTLGLSLTNQLRFEEAEIIFDKLSTYLNDRNDPMVSRLKEYLVTCNRFLLRIILSEKNIGWRQANKISKKIIEILPEDKFGLISVAISYYKIGDLDNSEVVTSKLIKAYPRSGAARINLAFMHILKGNYDRALRNYNRLFNNSEIDFETLEVVDFLNREFERTKEPALRYASGVITLKLNGDRSLAIRDLKEFISLVTEDSHGAMYFDAQSILLN